MKPPVEQLPFGPVGWTIAAFLFTASPHMLAMPTFLAVAIVLLAAWRLAAAQQGWRLPPAWLRLVLTLVAILALVLAFGGLLGRRAATTLLCLMLALKMLELYRVRDLRMVAALAFFLITAQFLFNERLLYLVYLLAGALLAITALISIQHYERGQSPLHGSSRALLRQAAVMLAAAMPVALILFISFPRLAQPLWGLPDAAMDGRTGLSDSMSPGSIATLYSDDSPAFRAQFVNSPPPPEQRYWRGPVLWHFDGDTWEQAWLASRTQADPVPAGHNDYIYDVQLEPHERRWLFALDYPVGSPEENFISLDYQISSRRPITTLTRYRMRSNPELIDMPQLPHTLRRLATTLPGERNPRTRELADALRERFADDRELIVEVLNWFRTEPFYYSLETAPLGRHGADEFLFDLRTGYCEYYASAFAIIMRFADIPARIVTGYQGGFWNSSGNYLLVRNSDAHAWVEVWLEGSGWTRVDPTAAVSPERIERGAQSLDTDRTSLFDGAWLRDLRNRYDRLQHLWNAWILGFDANRQLRLMRSLGLPEMSRTGMALLMTAALAFATLVIAWAWLRKPALTADPAQRAWLKLLKRMARRGLGKYAAETPRTWAQRLAPDLAHGESLNELVSLYIQYRYGADRDAALEQDFINAARAFDPQPRVPGKEPAVDAPV